MKDVLEFDSIELRYGSRSILSGVYMKCEVGEIVGMLGRNGSGKSSLMKVVFGSLNAGHQSIRINGVQLPGNHLKVRCIAFLPQHNLIPSFLSIGKALQLFKIPAHEILLHFPEVKDFMTFKPDQLSGGYKRIIETFLILKSKAKFCILDEPFSGLMPIHVERIKEIISNEKKNKGIIITDQFYRDVISMADRLYLLTNGKTYQIEHLDDLINRGYVNAL